MAERATFRVKTGLAEMLKGGVIMDVVTPEQAKIAEEAGACAVMALERVPADIRRDGGVARMSDPTMIKGIQEAVTIPVMAKARIGHFAEAQVLQALEVDYIDESEVLTPADESNHIDKFAFDVPFVCGATNLGEALRRLGEGAAMIRSKGEAGTGNVVEAVRHMREIVSGIKRLTQLGPEELPAAAKEHQAPLEVVREVAEAGRLPVPMFCAGRHRDARRRGADDAARRRGQLRRLRDLQERRPRAPGAGDRRGDHALRRPRAGRRRLDRPRRGDGRARDRRPGRRRRAAPGPRSLSCAIGVLAVQGGFEAHLEMLRQLGAETREVRVPEDLDGPRRPGHPRRREHDDHQGDRGGRARAGDPRPPRRRPARSSAPARG